MQIIARWNGIVLCGMILLPAIQSKAANYFYDPSRGSGASWYGVNAWSTTSASGPFDQTWVGGNTANFNFTTLKIASLDSTSAQVASLENGTANQAWIASASPVDLTFTGAATITGTAGFMLRDNVTAVGPFTLVNGRLDLIGTAARLRGTMTIQGGTVYAQAATLTTNSHLALTGGSVILDQTDTYPAIGAVSVSSGEFRIGRFNGAAVAATISSLSGTGGGVYPRMVSYAGGGRVQSLTVDQHTDTTFSGTLNGYDNWQGTNTITFTKRGTGELVLAGTVNLRQGTVIEGGRLAFNGAPSKQFHNLTGGAGSDAIRVASGGQLGGTATLSVLGGTDVTVESGGGLFAGLAGSAGRTTYAFEAGQGSTLDLSGMAAGTGGLHFDLGTNTTAGTTYDQVKITGGTLALGTGVLGINDLAVNTLPGLKLGTYVLIDSAAISGSLDSKVTGPISPEFFGTLRVAGNTLVLDVISQPGTLVQIR